MNRNRKFFNHCTISWTLDFKEASYSWVPVETVLAKYAGNVLQTSADVRQRDPARFNAWKMSDKREKNCQSSTGVNVRQGIKMSIEGLTDILSCRPEIIFGRTVEISLPYMSVILSPPVHIAQWAHMHHFLSICLSVRTSICHWKIHIGESIRDRSLKLYYGMSVWLCLLLARLWERIHVSKWAWCFCFDMYARSCTRLYGSCHARR